MKQNSFSYEQLIDCAKGILFGKGNAQLPMPPMLMFDRIININENGATLNPIFGFLTVILKMIR